MQRWIQTTRILLLVLIMSLVGSTPGAEAKFRFSFDVNFGQVDRLCRDGAEFATANGHTDGEVPEAITEGDGNMYTFRAELVADDTSISNNYPVTQRFHEHSTFLGYHVYAVDTIFWNSTLDVGTEVRVIAADADGDEFIGEATIEDCFVDYPITYQGRLTDGASSANGAYDFIFALFDSNTGGAPIGNLVAKEDVPVGDGLFTTQLNFSRAIFNSVESRGLWLEVRVRPGSSSAEYTVLTPRQTLSAAPYAIVTTENTLGDLSCYDQDVPKWDGVFGRWNCDTDNTGTGDITAVRAGTGLAGGGTAGEVTLNVDFASVARSSHNHLGQTWTGTSSLRIDSTFSPLVLNGNNSNGAQVDNNSTYTTMHAENAGSGPAVYGYSKSGVGGWFATYSDADILLASEEVSADNWNTRFRVRRDGEVRADGSFYSGTGGYYTGSADFAEMLPAAEGVAAGDLLVIGADGTLVLSTAPNATNVAGVYSTQPGFVGGFVMPEDVIESTARDSSGSDNQPIPRAVETGDAGGTATATTADSTSAMPPAKEPLETLGRAAANAGKIPLAIAGIVPVKVTAENGPIYPGDLLTTSSVPGHAMRATPIDVGGVSIYRPGTLIGKALEPWDSGTGMIRVLVALQ